MRVAMPIARTVYVQAEFAHSRRQKLAQYHLQDAAVEKVLDLGRSIDSHGRLKVRSRAVLPERGNAGLLPRGDASTDSSNEKGFEAG